MVRRRSSRTTPVGGRRGAFGGLTLGRRYRLRSKAAACTWVRQRVLPRWLFGSWCRQRHRVVRGRERWRWGRSVRRAPGGRVIEGRCIRDRRSDGWRTGRCTRGRDAGRNYAGGRRAPLRPLGTRKNPLLFRAGLTSGDDEDEEAHKERHEQGKALSATRSAVRTDPHGYPKGCAALRGLGGQNSGHSLSSRCQQLGTATSFHDRSPWREEHTQ